MYIYKLDDTVNKYNNTYNTYHKTIKMKPADVNARMYIEKKIIRRVLNLMIMLKYQNVKTFL